jgi:hypothetical protein
MRLKPMVTRPAAFPNTRKPERTRTLDRDSTDDMLQKCPSNEKKKIAQLFPRYRTLLMQVIASYPPFASGVLRLRLLILSWTLSKAIHELD